MLCHDRCRLGLLAWLVSSLVAMQGCICTGSSFAADGDTRDGAEGASCAPARDDWPDDNQTFATDWQTESTCEEGSQACGCWGPAPVSDLVPNEACRSGLEIAVPCYDGVGQSWVCDDGNHAWAFECTCE